MRIENGCGTAVDFAKAHEWYRKASVQGDPLAIGNLGMPSRLIQRRVTSQFEIGLPTPPWMAYSFAR